VKVPNRLLGSAVAAALLFGLLARWVMAGGSARFDASLRATAHSWASPALTIVMRAITTLGEGYFLVALGAVLAWHLASTGRRRPAVLLATAILSAELFSNLLKLLFQRVRPTVFFGLPPAENYSFPSGHAFVGALFYALLAGIVVADEPSRRKRAAAAALAIAAALLIGFSRVYLGYHYPSDVAGGWALAIVWLALTKITAGRVKQ